MAPTASLPALASLGTSSVPSATPCTLQQQQAGVKAKVALGGLNMPGGTPQKNYWHPPCVCPILTCPISGVGTLNRQYPADPTLLGLL